MKKVLLILCAIVLIFAGSASAYYETFFDNFDDGIADGWVFPYYSGQSQGPGMWTVENGTLVQSFADDANRALVDNLLISNQVIETQVQTWGYAGVVLWHQEAR